MDDNGLLSTLTVRKYIKLSYSRGEGVKMEIEQQFTPIIIGYYPFRAKAQVLRLVC
jgi:hypothetical protein